MLRFVTRVTIPEKISDKSRTEVFIPNGLYSDLILGFWCMVGFLLLFFGFWKSVFVSFQALVLLLKAVDVIGRKKGHNPLRTERERFGIE